MLKNSIRGGMQMSALMSALLIVGACSDSMPTAELDTVSLHGAYDFVTGAGANPDRPSFGKVGATPNVEFFEVCKRWEGAVAVAEFEVSADGTTNTVRTDTDFFGPFSAMGYADWMCRDVWVKGGAGSVVTVTETSIVGGANPYTTSVTFSETGAPGAFVSGLSVTGLVDGATGSGVTAFFTNTEVPPPPGDEGCTPGYWKQRHHFGNWTSFVPSDSYDAVFGVASSFDGSLLDALKRGGGKEKALGRHAVAALLNAANGGVASVYSQAQVIAMVQGAYASGDFNGVKDLLAAANELGCPLGRSL